MNNTRRSFFQRLTGLFAASVMVRASVQTDGLVPVEPPPHDGCIRIAWNVTLDATCEYAEWIAETLAIENDLLCSRSWSSKLKGNLVHDVRGSDGTIQDAVRIVLHKRVPITMWLSALDKGDRAILRKQLSSQAGGRQSVDDPSLHWVFQIVWPHDLNKAECAARRFASRLYSVSGLVVFVRRNIAGEVIPGFESYLVGDRKLSDVITDMTLQDRRALLAVL